MPVPKLLPILLGFCIGCGAAYVPAISLVQSAQNQKNSPETTVRAIFLRGVVRTIDREKHTIVFDGVSPYTLNEGAPFRITLPKHTPIWETTTVLGHSAPTIASSTAITPTNIDALAPGSPIIVRMGRAPGLFKVSSISTTARAQ